MKCPISGQGKTSLHGAIFITSASLLAFPVFRQAGGSVDPAFERARARTRVRSNFPTKFSSSSDEERSESSVVTCMRGLSGSSTFASCSVERHSHELVVLAQLFTSPGPSRRFHLFVHLQTTCRRREKLALEPRSSDVRREIRSVGGRPVARGPLDHQSEQQEDEEAKTNTY